MSQFTTAVANECRKQLTRWKNGTGRETNDPYYRYVGEYWSYGLKNAHIDGRTVYQDKNGDPFRPAWSSAFISYIMRRSGAGAEFYYHEGHCHYVAKALRDAQGPSATAKFLGRDPAHYVPKVGDLINAGRGSGSNVRYSNFFKHYGSKIVPKGNFIPSHSDIVVSVDAGSLTTIGGNVSVDTVGQKTWKLKPDGTLDDKNDLICIIECTL
ncbi:DUF2272 domain-containing protein [Methylobacterium nonmethylotrophicum]|uniref:DUF2272 domain-containing protein n=1 Tax=Methylobacterium nonmethylotrophicum TaxID=1141884 RepID=A0A4Z0NYB6_9HYPH|nr:DUF2272 domain-containing protein [Methylobacterium nonmethylotrophicum]TGE01726.1 DUF2272 domain-containing protein [Methylobacterium nonmethylotrophicum]